MSVDSPDWVSLRVPVSDSIWESGHCDAARIYQLIDRPCVPPCSPRTRAQVSKDGLRRTDWYTSGHPRGDYPQCAVPGIAQEREHVRQVADGYAHGEGSLLRIGTEEKRRGNRLAKGAGGPGAG